MSLSLETYNKLFKTFTDFAQEHVNANDAKAIADAKIDAPLGGRKMLAVKKAVNDSVHNWTRGVDQWNVNNNTRNLFRQTVAGLFGGEANIPESVRKAMLLSDYGEGKPLTARRIMAVKQAVETWKADMLPVKINTATAKAMIADAATRLGVKDLDEENATFGAECLKRYGSGLPAKTARVLANYIVNMADTVGIDEYKVEHLAKSMKGWREFDFGDPRLSKLGAKFVQRQNDYLTKIALPDRKMYMDDDPNIFTAFHGDTNRGIWKVGDTTYPVGTSPKTILDKFRSIVKNPNAQKVISTVLNQSSLADMETLLVKSDATVGSGNARKLKVEPLYSIKGGEMFVSRKPEGDGLGFATDLGITCDRDVRYGVEISKDGKTAFVTVSVLKDLNSKGWKQPEHNIGMATISQRTTIDLTKEMPEVINITFSQTFTPDQIILPAAQ